MCFQHCVDNFFTRGLSNDESNCLNKCVLKFSNVNQRVMGTYIAEQSLINERRMKDVDTQMHGHIEAAAVSDVSSALRDEMPATNPTDSGTTPVHQYIQNADDASQRQTV